MGGTIAIIVPIMSETHAYRYLRLCAQAQAPYKTCGPGHQEPHHCWTRRSLGSRGPPHRVGLGTWNDTRPMLRRTPALWPSWSVACRVIRTGTMSMI